MPAPKKYFNDTVKFPKLPRKDDLRYKLSKNDIAEIIKLGKKHTLQYLATKFNVCSSTILYYVNSEFRKKQMLKNAQHRHPTNNKRVREIRKIHGDIFREYNAVNNRNRKNKLKIERR